MPDNLTSGARVLGSVKLQLADWEIVQVLCGSLVYRRSLRHAQTDGSGTVHNHLLIPDPIADILVRFVTIGSGISVVTAGNKPL